nr:glycosyltransferase family 39 protein [Actinomycetota bacterium]
MATSTVAGPTASPVDPSSPVDLSSPAGPSRHEAVPPGPGRFRRLVRGRSSDPAWVRPALIGLLVATAVLYLVDLSSSGYANGFYSAAVQAGTRSWKVFFFGSSDAANFITVDKPPASLWMMEIPARIFGVNSWTILAPQALEGVAAVGLLYLTMRRAFSAGVGILAGAVLAITPVATLMFRFNNPDALLVLVLAAAAYATVRAVEHGRTRWLVAAGALVGFGFITKELQALIVVPPLALVYLAAGPVRLRRRLLQLLAAGVALFVSAGWWVAAVELTPAADRPYIGGSQNNNLLNLIFGYNGFGRLTGSEIGSVGGGARGGAAGGGMWGPTGLLRMFNSQFGTQIARLLPAALAAIVIGLWVTRRTARTNPIRAAFVLWGAWLIVTGLVFSLGQGIIHPYYSVALAPAVAALVAGAAGLLWPRRDHWAARLVLGVGVAGTVIWADVLLWRTPTWNAWLRSTVLVVGLGAAVGLALGPVLGRAVGWV